MKLLSLELLNFKGVKFFQFDTGGNDVSIYGDNGTGKTTICDALYWLLFDKDSQFKKQFEIKTLDKNGNPLPGLDHEVEGVFYIDSDKTLTLKKSYKEIWTKKRGDAQKTFTGHKTDYYIDEIPLQKNEFTKRASEYFVEETFKLLTTPTYFSETLPWKDRRELLLNICGNISDADVIKSDNDLSGLSAILKDRSIEDHKKVIASKKAKLNDEIKQIPVRIDEATRSIDGVDFIDVDSEKSELEKVKAQVSEKEKQISRIESGSEIIEQRKKISELDNKALQITGKQNEERQSKIEDQQKVVNGCREKYDYAVKKQNDIESEISKTTKEQTYYTGEINKLRELWHKKDSMQFVPPKNPENCPVCGQSIPEEDREKIEEKAIEEFNLHKSNEIEKVNTDGLEIKKKADALDSVLAEKKKELEAAIKLKEDRKEILDEENSIFSEIKKPIERSKEIDSIESEIKAIKTTIEGLERETDGQTAGIKKDIEILKNQASEIEKNLSSYEASLKTKERIVDLENQERVFAGEIEELERQLFLVEKFTIAKVELLESNINSKFKLARFKLFKTQINGGLDECCEVTYKGVPFGSGLNNGARINIGLDIIQTLSEHFNTTAPIFIDNAESVTEINAPENSQVIKMIVSEADDGLRVMSE